MSTKDFSSKIGETHNWVLSSSSSKRATKKRIVNRVTWKNMFKVLVFFFIISFRFSFFRSRPLFCLNTFYSIIIIILIKWILCFRAADVFLVVLFTRSFPPIPCVCVRLQFRWYFCVSAPKRNAIYGFSDKIFNAHTQSDGSTHKSWKYFIYFSIEKKRESAGCESE